MAGESPVAQNMRGRQISGESPMSRTETGATGTSSMGLPSSLFGMFAAKDPTSDTGLDEPSSGSAPAADIDALTDLLEKPCDEVATWLLGQMKELEAGQKLESTAIFKVANALKKAPTEKKEILLCGVMHGIKEMPTEQRTELLLLVATVPNLGSIARLKDDTDSPEPGGENYARLAQEAGAADITPNEMEKLAQAVRREQSSVVPAVVEIVPDLSSDERAQLSERLVKQGVVSEEHRLILEEALKPGGHLDRFKNILVWIHRGFACTWALLLVPALEGLLIGILAITGCGTPLMAWAIIDAVLAIFMVAATYAAKHYLGDPYKEFCENPLKTVARFEKQMSGSTKLSETDPESFRGMLYLMMVVVLMEVSAVMALTMGIMNLIATFMSPCDAGSILVAVAGSLPIMSIRVLSLAALGWFSYTSFGTMKEFKGKSRSSSSQSQPLIPE